MLRWQPLPYPTSKSPLDGVKADPDYDWLRAASTDPVFAMRVGHRPSITKPAKLALLQRVFWPALARWVEERQRIVVSEPTTTASERVVEGGWWRADMMGMLDWYRSCLGLTSRYTDAIVAHSDGVWRIALQTSPWWDWPEFASLLWEPQRDQQTGRLLRCAQTGKVLYRQRDAHDADIEDEFMDLWTEVANKRALRKDARGMFVLPVDVGVNVKDGKL